MQVENILLSQSGQMHPLIEKYLNGDENLKPFYKWEPTLKGIEQAIETRLNYQVDRALLQKVIKSQYLQLDSAFFEKPEHAKVISHLDKLTAENSFTVTTGHQLNIFTGPLYVIYKLISTIKYADELNKVFSDKHFIPVYWMASEDHDFEEINHIHLFGKKLEWESESYSAVGDLDTKGLANLIEELNELMGESGKELVEIFKQAYLQQENLALATRSLIHGLLGSFGLVILDANDADLKNSFMPVLQADLMRQNFAKRVRSTLDKLAEYKMPVNPRDINVFYLIEKGRFRIIDEEGYFQVKELEIKWKVDDLLSEMEAHPERFSPNVVLRPIYQEFIMPNVAYIGGTNEIAYWFELKSAFEEAHVFFPQLMVRDSAIWLGKKATKDFNQLQLRVEDLLLNLTDLKKLYYQAQNLSHPSEYLIEELNTQYQNLIESLQDLPSSFVAPIVKSIKLHDKEVKKWKKEVHKEQLKQIESQIEKLEKLHDFVFPDGVLQERRENFIPYYLRYQQPFFHMLYDAFNPLDKQMHFFFS